MKHAIALLSLSLVVGASQATFADEDRGKGPRHFSARLSGYEEVHFAAGPPAALRGAVSTGARGEFRATIDERHAVIHYELSYEGLEGTVTQAHIHFGQLHTVGGIVVWLCETAGTQSPLPDTTPECPQSGTVTGTIDATKVLALTAQGLDAGEFDELLAAMRAGATYANVHSSPLFGAGEIRGQIRGDRGHRD